MEQQRSIGSEEAQRPVCGLAAPSGESLAEAVTASLRERRDRERRAAGREAKPRDIHSVARVHPRQDRRPCHVRSGPRRLPRPLRTGAVAVIADIPAMNAILHAGWRAEPLPVEGNDFGRIDAKRPR